MKVIQVSFDTILITLLVDKFDLNDIVNQINTESTYNLYIDNNKVFIKWSEKYTEECNIIDVTDKRGIIQFESH